MILVFSALLEYAVVNSLTRLEIDRRRRKRAMSGSGKDDLLTEYKQQMYGNMGTDMVIIYLVHLFPDQLTLIHENALAYRS